jgi:hypothetical protein
MPFKGVTQITWTDKPKLVSNIQAQDPELSTDAWSV